MSKVIFLDRELQAAPEGNTAMVTLVGPDTLCVARVVGGQKFTSCCSSANEQNLAPQLGHEPDAMRDTKQRFMRPRGLASLVRRHSS